jgi:hypothetical protein
MTDKQLGPVVKTWLTGTDRPPADSHRSTSQIMTRLPQREKRRRWWSFHRGTTAIGLPTTDQTAEYQPTPIPATNGHSPTVTGRTQSMFSPAKAVTVGALVFALGGALFVAQPFDQQGGGVPGAEAEAVAPTWVTGDIRFAPGCSGPDSSEMDGDVLRVRNIECSPQTWTSSDPRLTAEVARRYNEDTYQVDEGSISVGTDTADLRNDGGGWACSTISLLEGSGDTSQRVTGDTVTCTGDGGYAGLSAVLIIEQVGRSEGFSGLIFYGDIPPLPEAPAAE